MNYRVVVTPGAEEDLDDLFRYIALDNLAAAHKFVEGLRRRLKTLASMPKRCPRAPEDGLDGLEILHLVYGQYRIHIAGIRLLTCSPSDTPKGLGRGYLFEGQEEPACGPAKRTCIMGISPRR
ncbi:MAG: type II toxin-antitoxin system RelE/ParE family toxin [Magnetospirillum sp. WYHS-4]